VGAAKKVTAKPGFIVSGISRFPDSDRRSPAPHRLAVSRVMPKKGRILIDSAVVERRPLYKVVLRG
jgi:hypothetical protein